MVLRYRATSRSSSSVSTKAVTPTTNTDSVLLCGSATKSLGSIVRHGAGDTCIVLNVGGTEFITLRSTVASNAVLADHVARAEANQELLMHNTTSGVFIDRDAKHFGFILQYLRNQVELEHSNLPRAFSETTTSSRMTSLLASWKTQSYMPQLPKDSKVLAELYVEATYYRIAELQNALHEQSAWTKFVTLLGLSKVGGLHGNPFVRASQLLGQARMALVALGTLTAAGTMALPQQSSKTDSEPDPCMEMVRKWFDEK